LSEKEKSVHGELILIVASAQEIVFLNISRKKRSQSSQKEI
jgi:hypothetical protein